jgi:CRISPR/Cas system-associated protein Cas5 (RAMP superfamily)
MIRWPFGKKNHDSILRQRQASAPDAAFPFSPKTTLMGMADRSGK